MSRKDSKERLRCLVNLIDLPNDYKIEEIQKIFQVFGEVEAQAGEKKMTQNFKSSKCVKKQKDILANLGKSHRDSNPEGKITQVLSAYFYEICTFSAKKL